MNCTLPDRVIVKPKIDTYQLAIGLFAEGLFLVASLVLAVLALPVFWLVAGGIVLIAALMWSYPLIWGTTSRLELGEVHFAEIQLGNVILSYPWVAASKFVPDAFWGKHSIPFADSHGRKHHLCWAEPFPFRDQRAVVMKLLNAFRERALKLQAVEASGI